MSYTWQNGQVITAEKLNQTGRFDPSEEAKGSIVTISGIGTSLIQIDKSWNELNNMAKTGPVIAVDIRTQQTIPTGGTQPDDLVSVDTVLNIYPLKGLNANIVRGLDGPWTQYTADFGTYQFEHANPDAAMAYEDID